MKLIIIESVKSFIFYKLENQDINTRLFCVHHSVKDYAWNIYHEKVTDLSEFISNKEIKSFLRLGSEQMQSICNELDENYSAIICKILKLDKSINIFAPLYCYKGIFKLASKYVFDTAISRILKDSNFTEIKFYRHETNGNSNPIFEIDDSLREICSSLSIPLHIICHKKNDYLDYLAKVQSRFRELKFKNLISRMGIILEKVKFSPIFLNKRNPNIFLYLRVSRQSLLDYLAKENEFQRVNIDGINFYKFKNVNYKAIRKNLNHKVAEEINRLEFRQLNKSSVLANIFKDFKKNCTKYMFATLYYQKVLELYDIKGFIWQYPVCIDPMLSMLNEFMHNKCVSVVGVQHGANYVSQNLGNIHFASDFNRCDYFLTYGWGGREFEITYGSTTAVQCIFIPVGSSDSESRYARSCKKAIDIVFPITNCAGITDVCRMSENLIFESQYKILKALNLRVDLEVYVKPERGYGWHNFAWTEGLKKFKNLKIGRETFSNFMKTYAPKLVIIEFPSTPLYDVLGYDVDIFLLNDEVHEFSEEALKLLKKRAYVFDNIDDMLAAIKNYNPNQRIKKRDQNFFNAYVDCSEKSYLLKNSNANK